jgi:branched-chain amino acid transport system substrate-binding protein
VGLRAHGVPPAESWSRLTAFRSRGRVTWVVAVVAILVASGAALLGWKLAGGENGRLTFGVLAPTSGAGDLARRAPDLVNGARLAAAEINENGGVLGRSIALDVVDDACSAHAGSEAATALERGGVAGVVGGACDEAAAREIPILDAARIPFLVTTASRAGLITPQTRYAYLLNGTLHQQALSATHWMNYRRAQRLAIVGDPSRDSRKLARETVGAIDRVPRLVSLQTIPLGKRDLRLEAKAALASHPDFVYWTGSPTGGGALARALHELGFKGTFTASAASESQEFLAAAGPGGAEGTYVTATASPQNMPDAGRWRARFRAAYDREPGLDALQAYDAVRALAQATRQAADADGELIVEQLPKLSDKLTTFIGPIRLARDHTLVYDNRVILVVRHGAFAWKRSLRTDTING